MDKGKHGPDKLYNKFTVVKTKRVFTEYPWINGNKGYPVKTFREENELTNKDEFIFVLRPETNDLAAIAALEKYAEICGETYPQLAAEIVDQLARIKRDYPQGNPRLR